ncbi:MAG: hypothetical protein HY613_02040, partial [Candidatus Rokubacteria bacterium]|nr:hypothetical protein [Candidatus Rokubacteria bacterium]
MEEMSVGVSVPTGASAGHSTQGAAPRDLREWIARVEAIGQLQRIT